MMHEFQIGIQKTTNIPIYYSPSPNPNNPECVYIYGKNEEMKNTLLSKIISHGIEKEHMIWILFGSNLGKQYKIVDYKIPIIFANENNFREYYVALNSFNQQQQQQQNNDITEIDIYSLVYDLYIANKVTKKTFFSTLQKKAQEFNLPFSFLEYIYSNIIFDRYSDFGTELYSKISTNTSYIFSFSYTDPYDYIKCAFIFRELRSIIKYSRLKHYNIHIGIICDNAQWLSQSVYTLREIHDVLFSWGRTFNVSRFIVQRENEAISKLISEPITNENLKNGIFSMIFYTDDTTFSYLNRCNIIKKKFITYDLWNNCIFI